jgi:hyperosmotically inducible periplasmic protein
MKQITITIFCLSLFTLSALAQDTPAADNTSKNQRDRSGETRTPGDQSNSSEDVRITAAIRSAVEKDDSLSTTAKNVKIITADGTITLRGPVKNEAERTKIAELAQSAAGNAKIDNQLEVKASK